MDARPSDEREMTRTTNALPGERPGEGPGQEGLKVIGAGFGRTGTLSLKVALEILGYGPCYHMTELFSHPRHLSCWQAATRGEAVNWQEIFDGYQSTVDWPGCTFYAQLMQRYPSAKVLLTVRDPERWYESASSTIFQVNRRSRSPFAPVLLAFLRLSNSHVAAVIPFINTLVWQGTFHGHFQDKEETLAVFTEHIEQVKRHVPPENLLVYEVKEGWEPLCAFLGVAVPRQPFPHLNDRASFPGNRLRPVSRQRLLTGAVLGASVLMVLLFLRRLLKGGKPEEP